MIKNILVSGVPKSGKSTLLDGVVVDLRDRVGFVTKEIRVDGQRAGFEIQTHSGNKVVLASVDFVTPNKVSKYFVSIENLDSVIPGISKFTDKDILYLDEIGQMELFSENFKGLVMKFLDSKNIFLATISQVYKDKFIDDIKSRKDVIFVELTDESREAKEELVRLLIKKIEKAKKYITEPDRFIRKDSTMEMHSEHDVRNLKLQDGEWQCNCNFFKQNKICSHSIATTELMSD